MTKEKNNVFQTILPEGQNQGQIFSQPPSSPVDNTAANAINAVGGLLKIGTEAYNKNQQDKLVKGLAGNAGKYMAAVNQGTMKHADMMTKLSAETSAASAANPQLIPEFRQAVIGVTGTDITAEHAKDLAHADNLEKSQRDTAVNFNTQTAVNAGAGVYNDKNELDVYATAEVGKRLAARNAALEQARINKSLLPSAADAKAEDERQLTNAAEGLYGDQFGSVTQRALNMFNESGGNISQQQLEQLGQGVQAHELAWNIEFNRLADSLGTDIDTRAKVKAYHDTSIKLLKTWATGDLNEATSKTRVLTALQKNPAITVAEQLSLATGYSENFGAVGANLALTELPKAYSNTISEQANNLTASQSTNLPFEPITVGKEDVQNANYTANTFNLNTGRITLASVPPQAQASHVSDAMKALKEYEVTFDSFKPLQQENSVNTMIVVSDANNTASSPKSIEVYAKYWNRPEFKNTFDKIIERGVNSAKSSKIANERSDYAVNKINGLKATTSVVYDIKTGKTNSPLVNELIENLNTFYPYTSDAKTEDLETLKASLFGVKEED